MSAELVLFLVERDVPLAKAKAVAEAKATSVAELTLAMLDQGEVPLSTARQWAEECIGFLGQAPAVKRQSPAVNAPTTGGGEEFNGKDDAEHAFRWIVPVVGPDGLTDKQRAALGNVGLCPNCQQPNNGHLPGCARTGSNGFEPMDPKARTKPPLPPAI